LFGLNGEGVIKKLHNENFMAYENVKNCVLVFSLCVCSEMVGEI
jgi:hypothetical protein